MDTLKWSEVLLKVDREPRFSEVAFKTLLIHPSNEKDLGFRSAQSVLFTMTSETGSLASKMPVKMPSAEEHLGTLKVDCGVEVAHPFPEQSLRFNQEKLGGVHIPDISQLEIQCKIRGRDTWWEWYYGRYSAFFEHANSVDPLILKVNYICSTYILVFIGLDSSAVRLGHSALIFHL